MSTAKPYTQSCRRQLANGHCIGIIDGDWLSPYIPGDVTNATTYSYPVLYKFLDKIDVKLVVDGHPSQREPILEAVRELADQGVRGISGDCGFLVHYQQEAARAVDIPVFLSSLLQLPWIDTLLAPERSIGIVAAFEASVTPEVVGKSGYTGSRELVISGLQGLPEFEANILQPSTGIDSDQAEAELVELCRTMQEKNPLMGAFLLECSMLPPYAHAIHAATKLPVFDFVTMINYFQQATHRQEFD